MEVVNEWTATDIELKTDTAAVLECLQRSMADEDDDEFVLYNHASNSELVPSLPPVSELKADLSTYYSDRSCRPDSESGQEYLYGGQTSYDYSANQCYTTGSQFTTLTNASSSSGSQHQHFQSQYYHQNGQYSSYQSTRYYQDYTAPGRQSASLIPTDLQQVTPTIQDLGTSIVSRTPIEVAPVDSQNCRCVYNFQPTIQDIGGHVEKQISYGQSTICQANQQRYVDSQPETAQYSAAQSQQQNYSQEQNRSNRQDYQQVQYDYRNQSAVNSEAAYQETPNEQTTSATQMLHDALEYIAPEVVTEHRDSLFNPIAALTNTLLENNFEMQPQEDYSYRYGIQDTTQDQEPQPEARKELRKKDLPKLLDIIKVYRCKACGFRSSDKLKAIRHTIESHSRPKLDRKARYACGSCHNHYATLEACGKHIGEKHAGLNTAVLKDGKLFKQLLIEPKRKTKIRLDTATQAQKIAWKRKLNRDQGVFVCEFRGCSIRFRADDTHRYHLRCHLPHPSEDEKFHCPVPNCKQGSKHWATLANHLWNEHHIDIELQACNRCDFKTYSLSNLEKVHKLVHSEEKQFECEECHSRYRTIKQLRNHKYYTHSATSHSEEYRKSRMASCPQCGQEMMKKNLKAHMRKVHERHQEEKSCPHCDFQTTSTAQYKSHIKIHLGARAMFCCEQCGFLTPDRNVHRKHLAQHTGEKPYKCRWCPYASIQACTYKQHVKKQHPEEAAELILRCNQCAFETISEDRLRQHNNKNHC